ncbi:MAG: hypothetical protein HXY25_04320 [Alphaproteobacteria bacterium]|nr:hypothetical protein [Alphaproteobacteria bacterium]
MMLSSAHGRAAGAGLVLALVLALAACGKKGSLDRPPPPDQERPEAALGPAGPVRA